jgi:hypothetical protein
MDSPQPTDSAGLSLAVAPDRDHVRVTLGSLNRAAVTHLLRWRLHARVRARTQRIVIDVSELDQQHA